MYPLDTLQTYPQFRNYIFGSINLHDTSWKNQTIFKTCCINTDHTFSLYILIYDSNNKSREIVNEIILFNF